MRRLKLFGITAAITIVCFIVNDSIAQGPPGHWRLGGNPATPPPDGVNATNNIFGTQPNLPIRIITNNTERLRITSFGSIQGDPSSVASAPRSFAYGLNLSVTG